MKKPALPVDRGWAWMVMIGNFINVLVIISFIRSLAIIFPVFLEKYKQSATITTLAFGMCEMMEGVVHVLIPLVFLKRFTVRALCFWGALVYTGCIMALAFTANLVLLNVLFGCIGLARGFVASPQIYILGCYFKQRLSFASACANTGLSLATLLSPLATRFFLDVYNLSWTFMILGAYSLHSVVASLLFRPTSMYHKDEVDIALTEEVETCIDKSFFEHQENNEHSRQETGIILQENQDATIGNSENYTNSAIHQINTIDDEQESTLRNNISSNFYEDARAENNETNPQNDARELGEKIDYTEMTDDGSVSTRCSESKSVVRWFQSIRCKSMSAANPVVLLFILAGGLGVNTQPGNVYLPVLGLENGLTNDQVPWLLTISGITDIISKLILGLVADTGCLHPIYIVCLTQTVSGISFLLAPFFQGMGAMVILCVLFGSTAGIIETLIPSLVVRTIGLPYLPSVISGYFLFNCVNTSITHVVVGSIKDLTGSFVGGFRYVGCHQIVSALILLLVLPTTKRTRTRHTQKFKENNCMTG